MFVVCCMIYAVCCVLFAACCLLFVVHQLSACCVLFACVLCVACGSLSVACHSLFGVWGFGLAILMLVVC